MNKSNSISKGKILAAALTILLVTGCGLYITRRHYNTPKVAPVTPPGGNLVPATKEEKQAAEDNKDRIVEEQKNNQIQPSTDKKQVTVIISSADNSSVKAYIAGVFEEGGTCTATFTQNDLVVSRTSTGFGNVSYTQCAPITPGLPNSDSWSVVVKYNSNMAEGTSKTQAF